MLANHSSNSDFRSVYFTPKLGLERVTLPSGLQTLAVSEFPLERRASDTPSSLQKWSFGFQVSIFDVWCLLQPKLGESDAAKWSSKIDG